MAQVLTASTYPLEVTMAARWSEKNPNLKDVALEDAMQKQQWDPSVKGLTSVPQVLAMMNEKLDWTNQLGEAFLTQPNDIQNAVQALRKQAETTGSLKSSKEQKVSRIAAPPSTGYTGPPEYIVIEPVEPDYIYVPVYDPVVVYGADYWPPAYVPFFWYPRWWTVGPAFGFGAALFVGPALWYHYNWGHPGYAAIQTNTALYSRFNRATSTLPVPANFKTGGSTPLITATSGSETQTFSSNSVMWAHEERQGIQTGRGIQGIQTGAGAQGVPSVKGVQGNQTGKTISGIQTSKSVQGIQTSKSIQGNPTGTRVQGVQTGKRIQTSNRVQAVRPAKAVQGGNKGKGRGKDQK